MTEPRKQILTMPSGYYVEKLNSEWSALYAPRGIQEPVEVEPIGIGDPEVEWQENPLRPYCILAFPTGKVSEVTLRTIADLDRRFDKAKRAGQVVITKRWAAKLTRALSQGTVRHA